MSLIKETHRGKLQTIAVFSSGQNLDELIETVPSDLGLPLGKIVWFEESSLGFTLVYFPVIGDVSSVQLIPITRGVAEEMIAWVMKGEQELILQPTPF
jgi:hypothetical protein